ncbi:hypothetical protein B0H14DRAFT_3783503 [Mycena olivaceomarginata]|nr:hypothetical protein B0H14DRAFT_3783503 [Mycena olivaceomarginata]
MRCVPPRPAKNVTNASRGRVEGGALPACASKREGHDGVPVGRARSLAGEYIGYRVSDPKRRARVVLAPTRRRAGRSLTLGERVPAGVPALNFPREGSAEGLVTECCWGRGGQGSHPILLLNTESAPRLDGGHPHPILSGLYYAAAKIEDALCRFTLILSAERPPMNDLKFLVLYGVLAVASIAYSTGTFLSLTGPLFELRCSTFTSLLRPDSSLPAAAFWTDIDASNASGRQPHADGRTDGTDCHTLVASTLLMPAQDGPSSGAGAGQNSSVVFAYFQYPPFWMRSSGGNEKGAGVAGTGNREKTGGRCEAGGCVGASAAVASNERQEWREQGHQ